MILNTLLSALFFYAFDLSFCLKYKDINFIISNIHASITFLNSVLFLTEIIDMSLYIQISAISIGYGIYDIYILKINNDRNFKNMLIHHLIIIIANIWLYIFNDFFMTRVAAFNYLTEISTPFLNLSLYLYQNNKTKLYIANCNLFKISNIMLILTFFIFRIVFGLYLVKITLFYNNLSFLQIILWLLNVYWFYKILKNSIKFI